MTLGLAVMVAFSTPAGDPGTAAGLSAQVDAAFATASVCLALSLVAAVALIVPAASSRRRAAARTAR